MASEPVSTYYYYYLSFVLAVGLVGLIVHLWFSALQNFGKNSWKIALTTLSTIRGIYSSWDH